MKKYALLIVISTIVLSAIVAVIYQTNSVAEEDSGPADGAAVGVAANANRQSATTTPTTTPQLSINGKIINLEIADTPEKQEQGLSGREGLADDQAMLFIFPRSAYWTFWMKDMNFSIDMIWLDKQYRVVYMQSNVSPGTFPKVFKPSKPARFVLETQAGFTEANQIKISDQLNIK